MFDTRYMDLKSENRSLKNEIQKLKSGQKYTDLEIKHEKELAKIERKYKATIRENEKSHRAETKELKNKIKLLEEKSLEKDKTIETLKVTLQNCENENHTLKLELKMKVADPKLIDVINNQEEYIKKLEELLKNLEDSNKLKDEIIKNQKTQIEKDYRNSSKPSSATPNHPTIKNGRVKSGKLKGGQKGHEGHPRKNPSADQIIHINDLPEEVKANPEDYVLLDRIKSRKVVGVKVVREVIEYQVPIWKNIKTGALVYGQFPANCVNEINYDESVKAFLMVLTCYLNVSIRKSQEFINNISEGNIVVSTGTICNLRKEFKKKSKKERDQIWNRLFRSPYMGSDTTFTRIQGKTGYIGIHCNDSDIYFKAGEKKGENLVTGTPLDGYQGVSVHDGEAVYSNHGLAHQQCLVHLFRYLRGAMEAEPELIWHKEAYDFLQEQTRKIETRKKERRESGHPIKIGDQLLSQEEIDQAQARYVEIMELAKQEYPERPAVYVDGFNTAKRMAKQQESILYFLDHPWVPWHNNESERGARAVKRKTKQSDGFKSLEGAEEVTAFLTIVESARKKGENIYQVCKEIYAHPMPKAARVE